jgi:hypothetical protein
VRTAWGIVYTFIAAITIAGIGLAITSVGTQDIPQAAVGACLFTSGVALFRVCLDMSWLKGARTEVDTDRKELARQSAILMADRTVFERERLQTLHQLDEQERRSTRELADKTARIRAQLAVERDRMLTEFDDHVAEHDRKVFAVGFRMGRHGVAAEQHDAKVIMLPLATDTMMGTGTHDS